MQIFLTSNNYNQCAKDLDDLRLNKIIIEAAQIASTAVWMNREEPKFRKEYYYET